MCRSVVITDNASNMRKAFAMMTLSPDGVGEEQSGDEEESAEFDAE